ncbi:MAG: outer membrane beta-barrel protein [Alphaproteobacteria bacterium]
MAIVWEIAASGAPRQRCLNNGSVNAIISAFFAYIGKALRQGIVSIFFVAAASLSASAQEVVTTGGTMIEAPLSGFEAPGISVGEFLLRSAVSTGIVYDSNILRNDSQVMRDYIFFVAPSFNLTRNGKRHTENVVGSVTNVNYARYGANDYTNISLSGSETYRLSNTSQILATGLIADRYEGRVSTNHEIPTNAASPIHQQLFRESLGFRKTWNRADAGATVTFTQMKFDDVLSTTGEILNQTDRNANDTAFDAFLNVQHSSAIRSNLTLGTLHSEVRNSERSVDTWRLAGTITVDLTSKTSISFLTGLSKQNYYNNPNIQTHPLSQYQATLQWSPMQRLTFVARGGYNETGVDYTTGISSGGISRNASLDMNYRIWRNLQLTSRLNYDKTKLSSGEGALTTVGGRVALTYELSSYAGLSFLYTYENFNTNNEDFTSYDESVFQTSLKLRF